MYLSVTFKPWLACTSSHTLIWNQILISSNTNTSWTMYNLVSCYDSLEMKARGDRDRDLRGEGEGLRISQSESILTDMTHVISPMSFTGKSPMVQQYQALSKWKTVWHCLDYLDCLTV